MTKASTIDPGLVRNLAANWRRNIPAVTSVGLGGTESKPVILVYTSRNLTKKQRSVIPDNVDGVGVVIKAIGRALPHNKRLLYKESANKVE
jgi:hypothetical protein